MNRDAQSGAALLEVVIALALTAMIAATLTSITGFGLSAIERTEHQSANTQSELGNRRSIGDILARISAPIPGSPTMNGQTDQLTWRGVLFDEDGAWQSGFWQLKVADMTIRQCQTLDAEACTSSENITLEQHDDNAKLSYRDRSGTWRDNWDGDGLPYLIRLSGDRSTIQIAPRVTGAQR